MSKSYFGEGFRYQPKGNSLHVLVHNALSPIYQEQIAQGYSPREIAHVIHHTVFDLEMESILDSRDAQKEQK